MGVVSIVWSTSVQNVAAVTDWLMDRGVVVRFI